MAVDLSKIKKHELYKEGYNDVWNAKPQSTWEQVQEIANNNIQKSNRSIWDDIGNAFQTMWRGLTSGTKNVPYYFANVQENNQQFVKDTEQQFLTNPKTSVDEKAKLNNIGINQIAVANSDGEAKEKFKKNLETAKNEKPETNLIKKSIADSIQEDQEVINQKQEEIENPVVKKVAEVAPSIGQMIPGMTLSAINPGAGALYFMSSSGGGYIKDALDRGMNDKEARLYGTLMGVMEGATEMIGVENLSKAGRAVKTLVKGTGKEIAKEGVKELGKTTIKTALKDYGIGIADNVIQESLMEPVQETIAGLVGGKDKANWNNMGQRMLQSGINGGLCSAIMGGANMGINSCVAVVDKINNGQTPTQQEMQTATKDVNKKVNVENLIIESTQQQINKYKQNATQNAEGNQIVTNLQNNLPQNTSNTPAEQQVQQTARQIEKVAQNGNMGQINANVQNQQQIDRTEAVNSLKQRAEKELTGSEKTEILDFLNNTPNIDESSIKSITGLINMARNDILNTDETYKTGRQQKYVKYMNKTNEYDSSVLQQAKEIVPANNQGRRTKEQWLQIAEQIGNNIADKSATEIEEIAYRTWQEERPASKESLNRQGKKYVQFTSDDWINTIYNTVKKIDSQNAQTISQSQQVNQEQGNNQREEQQSNQNIAENLNVLYNNSKLGEVKNVPIEDVIQLQTDGGYRSQEQVSALREDIKKNGITNPIELVKNNDGTIEIENGNHRLQIANELGLKEVPVKFVDSWRNIGENNDLSEREFIRRREEKENDRNNANSRQINRLDARYRTEERDTTANRNELKNGETTKGNDRIYGKVQAYNDRSSSNTTYEENTLQGKKRGTTEKVKNSSKSSFSVQESSNSTQRLRLPTKENIEKVNQNKNIPLSNKAQADRKLKVLKEDIGIKNDIITQKVVPFSESKQSEKVAQILSESPTKVKESDRKWAIFKAGVLDKGIVFEELSHKTKNRELQGKWDYTLSATARGQNAIGNARYEFDSNTKTQRQVSKSLEDIRTEVGENVGEFSSYMYHQLNVDRMTLEERFQGDTGINYERKTPITNKPVFGDNVTAEISRAEVARIEKAHPEFKEYAQDVYDFLNANKAELVNNGVISQASADRMADMYPHYVPIGRVDTKGNAVNVPLDTGRTGVNSPIKSAKGGNSDILPLFDTIAQRTLQTYRASARNSFGVELKNTLNTVINTEQTSVDNVIDTMGQTVEEQDLLQKGKNGSNPTFTVFENGEKVTYEITKDMYDALKPIGESSIWGKTIKSFNKISNFRRGVLTEYNPLFMITNAVKDMQDVLINSQHSAKTYSKFPEAYAQIVKKGYWYQEYVQNGGEQNSYFNANDNIFESDTKKSKVKGALNVPLNAISNINNVIELAPRLSEYIASREAGRSVETSMLDASRVTTNFKAGGDITKAFNRNGATFLNASVQGMMQQARNIAEANTKGLKGYAVLATKYAVAGLPALLLNNLIWKDDDDYDELQDYVKDNYYCIAKFGDGKFIRIPKGRMLSTIQSIVTNASEYITKDKKLNIDNFASDFWEDIQSIMDNVAPNNPLDNNVISPIIQAITNKSWYGEDIVPSRLQDKPSSEQYDETTDSLSKWLGEKLNISPYKINYLLDQYGGGISDVALPMMTKQAENNPIEDKFTTDSVMKSKYAGNFFDTIDKLKVNANGSKATDEDKIKYKYMSSLQGDLSELYTQKREIQNSDDSDEDKKAKLKEVQKQINQIAKDGLSSLDKLETTENTAKIGNKQYYKVTNLKSEEKEWKELSEEDTEKNESITLQTYADYKEEVAQATIKQRKSGELKEEQELKNVDKTKIILNSNCSDKEKLEVYKKYIGTQDKKVQLIEKLDFPIEGYLEYKTHEFANDKDTDGETISGTKRQKVAEYLQNIDDNQLPVEYKKIIAKIENINDFDKDIVSFVQEKDLSFDDKKELLEIIGLKVDKNGRVQTTSMIPIKKFL